MLYFSTGYKMYVHTHYLLQVTSTLLCPPAICHLPDDHSSDEESVSAPPYSPFSLSSWDEMHHNSDDQEKMDTEEESNDEDMSYQVIH